MKFFYLVLLLIFIFISIEANQRKKHQLKIKSYQQEDEESLSLNQDDIPQIKEGMPGKIKFLRDGKVFVEFKTNLQIHKWKRFYRWFYVENPEWPKTLEGLNKKEKALFDFYGTKTYLDQELQFPALQLNYMDVRQCEFLVKNHDLSFKLTQPYRQNKVILTVDFEFESQNKKLIQDFADYMRYICRINANSRQRHFYQQSQPQKLPILKKVEDEEEEKEEENKEKENQTLDKSRKEDEEVKVEENNLQKDQNYLKQVESQEITQDQCEKIKKVLGVESCDLQKIKNNKSKWKKIKKIFKNKSKKY